MFLLFLNFTLFHMFVCNFMMLSIRHTFENTLSVVLRNKVVPKIVTSFRLKTERITAIKIINFHQHTFHKEALYRKNTFLSCDSSNIKSIQNNLTQVLILNPNKVVLGISNIIISH